MRLLIKEITDIYIRENFQKLVNFISGQSILKAQWAFLSISEKGAVTNKAYLHGLKFTPTDVISTSVTGAGTLTFNYALFDEKYIYITTTGALNARAFVGRYDERGGE